MKKFIFLILMFTLIGGFSVYAQTDSNCEFECKNEHDSSVFECSETWAGPEQGPNKESCMRQAQDNLRRCQNTCIDG